MMFYVFELSPWQKTSLCSKRDLEIDGEGETSHQEEWS
jgi:hypothetical protein